MTSSRRKDEFLGEIEIQIHGGIHVLVDVSLTQYKRNMDFLGEIQIHGEIQSTSSMGKVLLPSDVVDPSPSTPPDADGEDAAARTRACACRRGWARRGRGSMKAHPCI
jgi:hypothetical protein